MISKLYAYGCSFTYGDIIGKENAWPNNLGKLLEIDVVNRGVNGGSNKISMNRLFEDITQCDYKDVFVVFSWTGIQRTTFYNEERRQWIPCLMGHTSPDKEVAKMTKLYYKHFYNDYEALYNYYMQILSVQSFLKERNIRYLFINSFREDFIFYDDETFGAFRSSIDKSKYVLGFDNNIYNEVCIKQNQRASDGFHPNEIGHQYIAKEIYDFLKGHYFINE